MALKHVLLVVAVSGLVLGVPVVLATGAFTSATLDRTAEVNVASDSQGLLALIDGHPAQDIVYEQDGTITIDLRTSRANGVNARGTFYIGDPNNPVSDNAFAIKNQGSQTVSVKLNYEIADSSKDPDQNAQNIIFRFYNSVPTELGSTSEETGETTISNLAPGESIYVVIQINTDGASPGADLSGDLQVTAVA